MNKRFYALVVMLVVAVAVFAGCNAIGGSVQGTGPMVSHDITAEGFTGLSIDGGYDLTFTQSPYFSVSIEIQDNLFEHLDASVRGGVLNIGFSRNISTTSGNTPRLYVSAPYLDSLNVRGAVNANITLDADELDVDVSGAGNVNLSGSANNLRISIEGAANISAFDMVARDVTISLEGAGNADVNATETLNASLSGVGRIRYDGDPVVTRNVTGLGTISRRN